MDSIGLRRAMATTGVIRIMLFPVTALASLVAAGIVIRDVGPGQFGAITLVTSLVLLMPFADLGLSAGVVNSFAKHGRAAAIELRIAWTLLCLSAVSIAAIVLTVEVALGWDVLLGRGIEPIPSEVVAVVLVLVAVNIPIGVGQRVLTGLGHITMSTLLQVVFPFANLVFTLGVMLAGRPALYALTPSLAQLCLSLVLLAVAVKRMRPAVFNPFRFTIGDKVARHAIWATGLPMMLIMLGLALSLQSHRLVLSHFSTSDELAEYSVAMALYAPTWALLSTVGLHLWPHFARSRDAAGRVQDFWRRWRDISFLGIIVAGGFLVFAPEVTRIWSADAPVSRSVWTAMAALLIVQSIHLPAGMLLTDASGLRFQAITVSVMTCVSVPLSIVLCGRFGAAAPIAASTGGVAICQLLPCLWKVAQMKTSQSEVASVTTGGRP